nr:GMC oxidoreductase [Flavimaribacter sediminis]
MPAPDQQLYFNAASYSIARARGGRPFVQADSFPGFSLCYQPTRPTSRGRISAVSADVAVPPRIELNALDTEKDRQDAVNGGRFIGRVVQTKALQPVIDRPLLVSPDQLSDEEILEDFRERCGTTFHQSGSCAMGNNPSTSVVDSEMRVHGVDGLYVVDASVFPSVPSGNINAPTLMVARRGVDFILKHQSSRTIA